MMKRFLLCAAIGLLLAFLTHVWQTQQNANPIFEAAFRGDVRAVHALLKNGTAVNVTDQWLNTPLHVRRACCCLGVR
jgi:hypothetical protein